MHLVISLQGRHRRARSVPGSACEPVVLCAAHRAREAQEEGRRQEGEER